MRNVIIAYWPKLFFFLKIIFMEKDINVSFYKTGLQNEMLLSLHATTHT